MSKDYLVTLKDGRQKVFTDSRDLPDYPRLLVSGMYGIVSKNPTEPDTILTLENVASIQPVEES